LSFDTALLAILCCPVTQLPLRLMTQAELSALNETIAEGGIKHRDGTPVEEPLEQALSTEDGRLAYPVTDGIPVLLEERGIALSQLATG
jgi:uncharacterized protein YbaR (Trm112 family)